MSVLNHSWPLFEPQDYFCRCTLKELKAESRPLEIDLGCGDGSFLIAMAKLYPEREFLGVERLLGRVRKVCRRIVREGLNNARVLRLESHYTVEWLLPLASVSRLHLLCPDPWPKARHHRRRLVDLEFLAALHRVLVPHTGELLFMSDHSEYAAWVRDTLAQCHDKFVVLPWAEDDFPYPKTDFQMQWEAQGKTMHRLRARVKEWP